MKTILHFSFCIIIRKVQQETTADHIQQEKHLPPRSLRSSFYFTFNFIKQVHASIMQTTLPGVIHHPLQQNLVCLVLPSIECADHRTFDGDNITWCSVCLLFRLFSSSSCMEVPAEVAGM